MLTLNAQLRRQGSRQVSQAWHICSQHRNLLCLRHQHWSVQGCLTLVRPRQKFSKISAAICRPLPTPGPAPGSRRSFRICRIIGSVIRYSWMYLQWHTDACKLTIAEEETGAGLIWVPLLVRLAGQADRLVLQR